MIARIELYEDDFDNMVLTFMVEGLPSIPREGEELIIEDMLGEDFFEPRELRLMGGNKSWRVDLVKWRKIEGLIIPCLCCMI